MMKQLVRICLIFFSAAVISLLFGTATQAQIDTITQTATITQTNPDYIYWNAEDFDRLTFPTGNPSWRVNFSPPAGSVSGKTLQAQSTGQDNNGGNDSFAIFNLDFTSLGDYTFYAYRLGGGGDSMFPPPDFGAEPFHAPGNNVNRWNGLDNDAWNELGDDGCCDSPAVAYYASGIRGAYSVGAAGVQEFIIEAREDNAQYDRFVLHKMKGLTGPELDALTFSNAVVMNPVPDLSEPALPLSPGNFSVRQVRITSAADPPGGINDWAEALRVIAFADGGANEGWNLEVDQSDTRNLIDIAGGGGTFKHNHPYPDGTANDSQDDVVVHVTSIMPFSVPEGNWTIAFGSDDGGSLTLPGVAFLNEINTNGDPGLDDTILFNGTRGHGWTAGEFTSPAGGMTVSLDAGFFERGGGDSFEIAISMGHNGNAVADNGDWLTLKDGAFGWSVVPEPSTFVLSALGLFGFAAPGWRRHRRS